MLNKRRNVAVLGVVQVLKGLDCDSARGHFVKLEQRTERLQQSLSTARHVEGSRASGLQTLLSAMPTFDPVLFRSGVASVHAAARESKRIEVEVRAMHSQRELARAQLLQATAGHEIIKKEYRKSVGKLTRAQAQASEAASEDRFATRLRSSHVGIKFSV